MDRRRIVAEGLRNKLVPEHIGELMIFTHLEELDGVLSDSAAPDVVVLGCNRATEADLQIGEALLKRFEGRVVLLCDYMP
ncbi:hypothetical protein ACFFRS_27330, partial [Saccharopolyspora hordei]|uniref:hypothetical protein n=1 Tax=Saccharopolyspora hordei TaxID=1838 RepID=UPI0035EB622B